MIVTTPEQVEQLLEFINSSEELAYDTETTGLNPRRDKVIGFGIGNGLSAAYVPIYSFDKQTNALCRFGVSDELINIVLAALKRKRLIMFNAAFDTAFTKRSLGADLVPVLYCDVLLLKHTCDEEFPFGLKEIAAKRYGHDVKKEKEEMLASIKANGGRATEYFKADVEVLGRYCMQDCNLTFRLYTDYSKELRKQGLEDFYYKSEVLPLYKEVTIPMQEAGVHLNMDLLRSSLAEICEDLKSLEIDIQAQIQPMLGIFTEWFLNKEYPVKKRGRLAKVLSVDSNLHIARMRLFDEDYPGQFMFNLLSKHHLKKLFFDTLGEKPLSRTPKGSPQVNEEFLDSMGIKYAWAKQLIDYNKLVKIKGTYIERLLNESEDGKFYPAFLQHRTVSGRYAGDLQQLPRPLEPGQASDLVRKHNNRIREFIVPAPGCKLVSADYESLEPSIFAHVSGDPALINIFKSGLDFYSEIAIRTERLEGVSADKTAANFLGKVNKSKRQSAKPYALGIPYGMTGYKLHYEINQPVEVCETLVDNYWAAFPTLRRKVIDGVEHAVVLGYVQTEAGRKRRMPRLQQLRKKYGASLDNFFWLKHEFGDDDIAYSGALKDRKEYRNLVNNVFNMKVQGLAASIVNRAAIQLAREFKCQELKAKLVMQVHDELVFNIPDNELELACPLIKAIMESIWELKVPLRTTPQTGTNFKECK